MPKITQRQLVKEFIRANGEITPAQVANSFYAGGHFGSEVSRVCRAMRGTSDNGELRSFTRNGLEVFVFRNADEKPGNQSIPSILQEETKPLTEYEKKQVADRLNQIKQHHEQI